jgi:hypothetical protein
VKHAGYWLRDDKGNLTKKMRHICWDGCMFPNAVMESQATWNKILGADDQGARRARLAGVAAPWLHGHRTARGFRSIALPSALMVSLTNHEGVAEGRKRKWRQSRRR